MRLLSALLAAAGIAALGGCAAYDDGYATTTVYGTTAYTTAPAVTYYSYSQPVYPAYPRTYRDRDGDGVPNLYDRRPDNPYRQ